MNFLSESLTARIKEQVKDQLPQILPQEVSNLASPVIKTLIRESRDKVNLARSSLQPQSTYEAASTLTEFELKKILIYKMEKSESYLAAPEHRNCYDGLKKSYALDQDFFQFYNLYSLKRSREDKDKDKDPTAGSDRGTETVSRQDWFKKPVPPQACWHDSKTRQEGPSQSWLMDLTTSTSKDKSLKCLSDEPLAVPLDEIHIDDKLYFVEEPVEILDREVNKLRRSRIPIIKVRWNGHQTN
ncbi:hypothetical protein Tco_1409267 [Tanacetum coccineum]